MKQRVFIGSSSEKLHIARAIESNLAQDIHPDVVRRMLSLVKRTA